MKIGDATPTPSDAWKWLPGERRHGRTPDDLTRDFYAVGRAMRIGACVGRVSRVRGGILQVMTPGSSTLEAGVVWFRPLETAEDRAELEHQEQLALARTVVNPALRLYGGVFPAMNVVLEDANRARLRRAWPKGCLPIRGVQTVGGYTCVAVNGEVSMWCSAEGALVLVQPGVDTPELDRGELLPRIDSTDTATWTCLLRRFCEGTGLPESPDEPYTSFLCTRYGSSDEPEAYEWAIECHSEHGRTWRHLHPDLRIYTIEVALLESFIAQTEGSGD